MRFAICASARERLCGALVMSPESPGMMQTKTRDEIDFDWAYVQLLCLEQDAVADMVRELYPELEGSQDFLDEFNLVQDHRQLQTLAGLAADIEAAISTSGDGVNLDRKIATAEKMLTAYLRGKLQKIKTLLEEVSKDDQSEILIDADVGVHDNELMLMLPLFYDFSLVSTESGFFRSRVSRDVAFKAFGGVLKSSGSTLAKLKNDYKTLLKQEHCFLSMAPFDNDFKEAQDRFEAGENTYLSLPAVDETAADDGADEAEDRTEIRVIRSSIIDRQKYEAGDILDVYQSQAETLIALGKAEYATPGDAGDQDAAAPDTAGHAQADDPAIDQIGPNGMVGQSDSMAGTVPLSSHAAGASSGTSPWFLAAMIILLVLAGWAMISG